MCGMNQDLTYDGEGDVGCGLVALVVGCAGVHQRVLLLHAPA